MSLSLQVWDHALIGDCLIEGYRQETFDSAVDLTDAAQKIAKKISENPLRTADYVCIGEDRVLYVQRVKNNSEGLSQFRQLQDLQ